MRKILGLCVFGLMMVPHVFAGGENFADHGYTGTVFRNTHKNIGRTHQASTWAVFVNRHKNTPSKNTIPAPAIIDTGSTISQSKESKTWTGLISPSELELIGQLSEYAVPRNTEAPYSDPVRSTALIFLSMAVFFFCVELFTGRLFALAITLVSMGASFWAFLAQDARIGWGHMGVLIFTLGILVYILPRVIRSYADDLGMLARNNEDPTS